MTLISRQVNIATTLLNNPQIYKVKDLSQKYGVSTRTLRNDLNKIARWVNTQPGCQYQTKPGKGIWISFAGDSDRKKAIVSLQTIANEEDRASNYLTPNQRKWKILTKLVFSDQYITGKKLAQLLGVSSNTFLSDLGNAKRETEKFNLELISKNYYGYSIVGQEINRRALMEYILQQQINIYSYGASNLMDMLTNISTKVLNNSYLPEEVNQLINYIALILSDKIDESESFDSVINLNVTKSMINRLTIIIFEERRKKQIKISTDSRKLNAKQIWYRDIYRLVSKSFGLRPSFNEEQYFIFGVKLIEADAKTDQVVEKIINDVATKLNLPLANDFQLRDSLSQHLMSELNLNYQYFSDYTPFTDEVKSRFGDLFEVVKSALKQYISQSPLIVSDTFVTLVSLHFLVSISDLTKVRQIRALYVCSTGLGATRLLEKTIQKRIPAVSSVGFASVINYRMKIQELEPELVISIFPLEKVTGTTIIQVNPIPNEQDLSLIEQKVSQLLRSACPKTGLQIKNTIKRERSISTTEKVLSLALEAFIEVNDYLIDRISKKYQKAFMIHVQLATERIYFDKQYDIKPSAKQTGKFLKEDINKLKEIYQALNLEINISEILAILRYTLLN